MTWPIGRIVTSLATRLRRRASDSAPWQDVDKEFGWDPVPEPPPDLVPLVMHGQRALWDYARKGSTTMDASEAAAASLHALAASWDKVVAHSSFTAASIPFQLALLNRAGIAHMWQATRENVAGPSRAGMLDELKLAIGLFERALSVAPASRPESGRIRFNLGGC